jgi:hypothetical protein
MIDILRFLFTGRATQLDTFTGEVSPVSLPWNIRRTIVFSILSYRLLPWRRNAVTYLAEDDTQEWNMADLDPDTEEWDPADMDDWLYNRDKRREDENDA